MDRAGSEKKMNRKPGDWTCSSCHHLNFSRRESCHRCGGPRPSGDHSTFGGRTGAGGPVDVRPGDWNCSCGAHNFASRTSCFRCSSPKEDTAVSSPAAAAAATAGGGRAGWKPGDWICKRSGCNEHNFASRTECFRCSARRDDRSAGTKV